MQTRFFVYILLCRDQTLYTGFTTHPYTRKTRHNSGKGAKYTKYRRPVYFCYLQELPDRSLALKREREIKTLSRKDKLDLIEKNKDQTVALLYQVLFRDKKKKQT